MPDESIIKQNGGSAVPPAGGRLEETIPTSEAAKIVGVSARTLKRRAERGELRRSSIYTQFGLETR